MADGARSLGDCAFCGNQRVLNARGLCTSCKNMEACANHPDLLTAQRCKICRKPACAFCIERGVCTTCRQEGRELPKAVKPGRMGSGSALAKVPPEQLKLLAGLAGSLVLAFGFNRWWFADERPSASALCRQRVSVVQSVIDDHNTRHGKPPGTLVEMVKTAEKAGKSLPVLIPDNAHPVPGAVVYSFDGKHYTLKALTDTGVVFSSHGHEIVVQAP